jgi:Ca2+:H+ antiporter
MEDPSDLAAGDEYATQRPDGSPAGPHRDESGHHVFGFRPTPARSSILPPEAPRDTAVPFCTISNIIWCVFVGSWVSLLYIVTGLLFFLTIYCWRHGVYCFRMASYIFYPFGRYVYRNEVPSGPENLLSKFLWILFSPIYGLGTLLGLALSWEFVYYIPMAKFLWRVLEVNFDQPTTVEIIRLEGSNPARGYRPSLLTYLSGSAIYFQYSVFGFEVPYLNFFPFVVLAGVSALVKENSPLFDPIFGAAMGILGAVPCAYVIGICVDELSHQLGLVLGSILNSTFLTIVELLLYYFSLANDLAEVVRSAVTGAFLMNLLIIPGCGMLAAGLKWPELTINKRSQSISGTFLLLSVTAVLFPSIFYHIHSTVDHKCGNCVFGNTTAIGVSGPLNCTACTNREFADITNDPIYKKYGGPLMTVMAIVMPIVYIIGVYFSVKSHAHIFEPDSGKEHEPGASGELNKWVGITILIAATLVFSLMAHVITDKIPHVIDKIGLSQRFVGLVFFTIIPNAAEYMNAIKFALDGKIGLAMEIGNQGAILAALFEMPALVLMSYIQHKLSKGHVGVFTLVFPLIDIFCVMMAVLLRNSILLDKTINYFTGTSFLIIMLLISVVYYFEVF